MQQETQMATEAEQMQAVEQIQGNAAVACR
jgi:hypothetical protein